MIPQQTQYCFFINNQKIIFDEKTLVSLLQYVENENNNGNHINAGNVNTNTNTNMNNNSNKNTQCVMDNKSNNHPATNPSLDELSSQLRVL